MGTAQRLLQRPRPGKASESGGAGRGGAADAGAPRGRLQLSPTRPAPAAGGGCLGSRGGRGQQRLDPPSGALRPALKGGAASSARPSPQPRSGHLAASASPGRRRSQTSLPPAIPSLPGLLTAGGLCWALKGEAVSHHHNAMESEGSLGGEGRLQGRQPCRDPPRLVFNNRLGGWWGKGPRRGCGCSGMQPAGAVYRRGS